MRTRSRTRNPIIIGTLLALGAAGTGCRIAETAVGLPTQAVRLAARGDKAAAPPDPIVLQQDLLRYADDLTTRVVMGIDKLRRGDQPLSQEEALQFKLAVASQVYAIASGSHSLAALVDLTVFVTVTRKTLENPTQAASFGDSVQFLASNCRHLEEDFWSLAEATLRPEHLDELKSVLDRWEKRDLNLRDVFIARAEGMAGLLPELDRRQSSRTESVFGLLGVDPLAGVDPAVREVARTRLFAERALFVMQRMPRLLRWQTELMTLHATELPAVQQVVANAGDITASLNQFVRVAEQLPGQLAQERAEIVRALESQESRLTPLTHEVRQALLAGSQMSTSLTATIGTFDALMKRFGVGEAKTPKHPPADSGSGTNSPHQPFRIQDYGETAARIEGAARELRGLIESFQDTLGSTNLARLPEKFGPAVQQAQESGKEVVDYAFRKGVLLVAISLAAALVFRFLVARMPLLRSQGPRP